MSESKDTCCPECKPELDKGREELLALAAQQEQKQLEDALSTMTTVPASSTSALAQLKR